MGTIVAYLVVYFLGGITFIPVLLLALFYHAYKTQPIVDPSSPGTNRGLDLTVAEEDAAKETLKNVPIGPLPRTHEPDGVASYFAVCREYVPGGVDGKPPERNPSRPASVLSESPSVYQSMYRSLFERGKSHSPSLEGNHQKSKKTRNVFFVVIRYVSSHYPTSGPTDNSARLGTLMLYDDEEHTDVRYVIPLENYDIDIYGGGEHLLEGELWVKRNCIRMVRRGHMNVLPSDSKPFYLFSNNCSKKEDFYHAMLQNQRQDDVEQAQPLTFETDHIVKLFRQLHASEDNLQTRWINALIGRVFLSLYKTSLLENFVRTKINKKLSRVVKPAFISAVQIRRIHLGDSAPFITGPKLRELTQDGDLTIEADIKYKGNARIDVAAIARIDLGTRFKAREVELLLAVILKSLEGQMYIRIKPPPSNRIWISFVTMPKLELSVEPVISSRQITYGLILRAIESRIREVLNETLVFPNWDDMPFFDTLYHDVRGGVWKEDSAEAVNARLSTAPTLVEGGEEVPMQEQENADEAVECAVVDAPAEAILQSPNKRPSQRRNRRASSKTSQTEDFGVASGVEANVSSPPKAMRSHSFATAAIPIVTKDPAITKTTREMSRSLESDAASNLKDITCRSQPSTPNESPVGSPNKAGIWRRKSDRSASITSKRSGSEVEPAVLIEEEEDSTTAPSLASQEESTLDSESFSLHKRQTIASTAAAARKWGLGLLANAKGHSPSNSMSSLGSPADPDRDDKSDVLPPKIGSLKIAKESLEAGTSSIAYGRGMPLPPIGTPLPGPANSRKSWTAPLSILGRKKNGNELGPTSQPSPNPSSLHSVSDSTDSQSNPDSALEGERPTLPPRLKDNGRSPSLEEISKGSYIPRAVKPRQSSRRKHMSGNNASRHHDQNDSILVITAPDTDTDHDSESLASPDRVMSPEISRSTDGVLESVMDDHENEDMVDETSKNAQLNGALPHNIHRKPMPSQMSLPALTTSNIDDWTTSNATPNQSALSSPVTTFSDSIPEDHPIRMRKARSRQSLIPTPTSSRKTSPVGSTTPQGQLKAGRRTSMQSLQDMTKTDRRRSSGFVQ